MRRSYILAIVPFFLTIALTAADKKDTASLSVFPDVTARGRMLYEYDQAAWHASDAVESLHAPVESLGRYIAHKSDKGWVVVFGHLNEARNKFVVAYEATQGATLQEFSANKIEPAREDSSFNLFAARAIDIALRDFKGANRPYNVAVLPATADQLYIYVMPAQTQADVYPLGGDARYLISSDGNAIVEKRQLHKTILEIRHDSKNDAAGFHTHVLSEVPEDTDVFHVLTQKPPIPEYVGTLTKKLYIISVDGTISEGKL